MQRHQQQQQRQRALRVALGDEICCGKLWSFVDAVRFEREWGVGRGEWEWGVGREAWGE